MASCATPCLTSAAKPLNGGNAKPRGGLADASMLLAREACEKPGHQGTADQERHKDDKKVVPGGGQERKPGEHEVGQEDAPDNVGNAEPPVAGALIEMAAMRLPKRLAGRD